MAWRSTPSGQKSMKEAKEKFKAQAAAKKAKKEGGASAGGEDDKEKEKKGNKSVVEDVDNEVAAEKKFNEQIKKIKLASVKS